LATRGSACASGRKLGPRVSTGEADRNPLPPGNFELDGGPIASWARAHKEYKSTGNYNAHIPSKIMIASNVIAHAF